MGPYRHNGTNILPQGGRRARALSFERRKVSATGILGTREMLSTLVGATPPRALPDLPELAASPPSSLPTPPADVPPSDAVSGGPGEVEMTQDEWLPRSEGVEPRRPLRAAEVYAEEEGRATTRLQRKALGKLQQLDPYVHGKFGASQTLEFTECVRVVREGQHREWLTMLRQSRRSPRELFTCDCIIWFVIVLLFFWAPMLVAAAYCREFKAEPVLTTGWGWDNPPAATGDTVSAGSVAALLTMPDAKLRRIRSCRVNVKGSTHYLAMASIRRLVDGTVAFTSQDGSTLRVAGSTAAIPHAELMWPFHGTETVDLSKQDEQGCRLAVMGVAP